MRVWLTQTSEPYPFLTGSTPMRTSILADELVKRGHEVTWWGSNIEHRQKKPLAEGIYSIAPRYAIRLLPVPAYKRNISWARYRGYKVLARSFLKDAPRLPAPDIVVAGLPVHDLAYAAIRFADDRSIPSLVDIRDLWPDHFVGILPRVIRTLGRAALSDDFRRARFALSNASGIIAISTTYLEWGLSNAGRSIRETDGVFFLGSKPLDARPSAQVRSSVPRWRDDARIIFGFLGVFGHTYDLQTVLAGARLLAREGDLRAHFVLAGTGDFASQLSRQAEGLPNVSLPGWLNATEVDAFLRHIDVGLAAYAKGAPQSLPNKPFQYFAAGKPVLSSLGGELRDILETAGAGVYYDAGDPRSLVSAVRFILDSSAKRSEMAFRATELFHSNFNARLIYPRLADHIEAVAAPAAIRRERARSYIPPRIAPSG